jgi:hypothetical protein
MKLDLDWKRIGEVVIAIVIGGAVVEAVKRHLQRQQARQ